MPITQSRLIDLLSSARDWKRAFDEKSLMLEDLARTLNNPQLNALISFPPDYFLSDPIKTNTTLAVEEVRVSHTKHYNENRRLKKARKAAAEAIPTLEDPEDIKFANEHGFTTYAEFRASLGFETTPAKE